MPAKDHFFGVVCFILKTLSKCSASVSLGQTATGQDIKDVPIPSYSLQDSQPAIDINSALVVLQPGSNCAVEGQWNCLTTCWQRCASGVWFEPMALSSGTVCAPAGLTYDLQIVSSNSLDSSNSLSSAYDASFLSKILSVTTGPCSCIEATPATSTGCSATLPSTPSTTTAPIASGSFGDGGGFVSGSSTATAGSRPGGLYMAAIVGTLAIVFAHLLM
ncbi:hypothetical protein SEPCBS57363_000007 [Sporothrix epigloea]|uniref:Uncharacterized protein n=1 Tax=Sporothrix epigloea TaxID=1892477 RepID=A0ABP0D469_9PEZI